MRRRNNLRSLRKIREIKHKERERERAILSSIVLKIISEPLDKEASLVQVLVEHVFEHVH